MMVRLALYAGLVVLAVLLISALAGGNRSRRRSGSEQLDDVMVLDPTSEFFRAMRGGSQGAPAATPRK